MDRLEVRCYLVSADPPSVRGQGLCFVLGDIGLLGPFPNQLTRRLQIGHDGLVRQVKQTTHITQVRLVSLPGVWDGENRTRQKATLFSAREYRQEPEHRSQLYSKSLADKEPDKLPRR